MSSHLSVLLQEVVTSFAPCHLKFFIDGTLGAGGHAEALLKAHPEIQMYMGIDQDSQALALAAERLKPWKDKVVFKQGNFENFDRFLNEINVPQVDGILVDLGVSSMQLDQAQRGFSFSKEGPLDMRMNSEVGPTAADVVNNASEQELGRIIREYGEEKRWRNVARAIVQARQQSLIVTTTQLAQIIRSAIPWNPKKGINPATLVFQALRICVNRELEVLEIFVPKAIEALATDGRLAVISFHSLEDRIVKNQMRFAADDKWETSGLGGIFRDKDPLVRPITRKPLIANEEEVAGNPRSRSAKLRVAEKLSV